MLDLLFATLLQAAISLSGYPSLTPEQIPHLQSMPQFEMTQMICKDAEPKLQPSCMFRLQRMEATYDTDNNTIYYADYLTFDGVHERSVIVHEFVHVLQHFHKHKGHMRKVLTEDEWVQDEHEAIAVQIKYLKQFESLHSRSE